MKKMIFSLLLFSFLGVTIAQQQNIELPDFVITGRQSVEIQAAQKPKPELISILSQEFFTPQYSPEELPILIASDPVTILPQIKTSSEIYAGNLKVMVGKYSLPVGELNISRSYENYLFGAKLWGSNITEYVPNAGYNNSGFAMSHDFYLSTRSVFMPGTKISVDASYWRDSYKFYGSINPDRQRESNNGNLSLIFRNNYGRLFNTSFGVTGNIHSFNENNFKETNLSANGLVELKLDRISIGGIAEFKMQQLVNSGFVKENYDNLTAEVFVKAAPINSLNIKAGAAYSSNDGDTFITPLASADYLIDKGFRIAAQYKPYISFMTYRNFIEANLYSEVSNIPNTFTKYKNDITAMVSYEFQKTFLISASANYSQVDNYIYFGDPGWDQSSGRFIVEKTDNVDIIKGELKLMVYPSRYGSLYADIIYQEINPKHLLHLPYQPMIKSAIDYTYNFDIGLALSLKYENALKVYTNNSSINQLTDFHNISAVVSFELLKGLKITGDFQNILNRSNFAWEQYQLKPFDYLVGVEYRW